MHPECKSLLLPGLGGRIFDGSADANRYGKLVSRTKKTHNRGLFPIMLRPSLHTAPGHGSRALGCSSQLHLLLHLLPYYIRKLC